MAYWSSLALTCQNSNNYCFPWWCLWNIQHICIIQEATVTVENWRWHICDSDYVLVTRTILPSITPSFIKIEQSNSSFPILLFTSGEYFTRGINRSYENSSFNKVYANMAKSKSTLKSHGLSFPIILLALAYKQLSRHEKCSLLKGNYNNS